MTSRPHQLFRLAPRSTALFLVLLLLGAVAAAGEEPSGPEPDQGVWITIGADAFETLRLQTEISFEERALERISQRSQVVLTRVHVDDLPRISAHVHNAHRRCGGFIVHRTRKLADRALEKVAAKTPEGAPIAYTIDQQARVQELASQVESEQIREAIDRLSSDFNNRYYQHPSGTSAAHWIRDRWQSYAVGREDVTVELFEHSDWSQPSVILTIPGATLPDEWVVLGGHLDSIASGTGNPDFIAPGADDDGSGIAVLTETIRVALAEDFRPQRSVAFMGYAAEEVGLRGSQDIASTFGNAGTNVVAVLQLDMTAFNGSVEDIGLLSDFTNNDLTAFVGELITTYQPDLQWTLTACGYGCSDHASWHGEGYPAAMSFESRFGQHNSAIHSTSDTLTTLGNNADHAAKFARLALAFAVEIGIDGGGDVFSDSFESGTTAVWSSTVP